MQTRLLPSLFAFSLALLALSAATPAFAAEDAADGSELVELEHLEVLSGREDFLKPVTVANRLPLTIRQTPQSISVVDRLRMDTESLFSVNEVLQTVTGVSVTFYDTGRPLYYARGFQITDFQVDGMPTYSGSTNQEYDTAIYERVDVIRGANGLLSGPGLPSATVNLQRKRPGKEFAAGVSATAGSWDYYRAEADVTVPLTTDGRFRSRFVAAHTDRESFLDRFAEDKTALYGIIEGDLTATTTLGLGWQNQDNNPVRSTWGTLPRFAADGSLAHLPRSLNFATNWTLWQRESTTAFIDLKQQLGETWTFRAAYNRTEGNTVSRRVYATGYPDPATGAGLYLRAGVGEGEDTRDAIDAYLTGKFPLLGREHDLVVGWNSNAIESFTPTLTSVSAWTYVIPNVYTYDGNAPAPAISRTGAYRLATTDLSGFYSTLRLRLLEPLSAIAGARLSQWETYTDNYNTAGVFTTRTGGYKVSDEVTPYFGLVYDLTKTWSAYASYTDIFRPQNYKDKDNNLLDPVLGTNVEGGVKAEFFAGRLHVSSGIFQTKQDNYAVRDSTQPDGSLPDGGSAYIGVDGTETNGFEFEIHGHLVPGWWATLGYSYVNTRRHANDLIYVNLPENLVQFSTHYQLPGKLNRLTVGGGVNWQSEVVGFNIPHPTLGTVTVTQDAYALINGHLNYRISDHLTATLTVRNAFDKTYWATLDYPNYGEPRNLTLSLKWRY
jgi:outer membrane receptor for ferric coprogen and ferric-rhodotorulic acid